MVVAHRSYRSQSHAVLEMAAWPDGRMTNTPEAGARTTEIPGSTSTAERQRCARAWRSEASEGRTAMLLTRVRHG